MKKRAFTLIELLVVIAIIALLLSIIMPALATVKRQARKMVCATRIRQCMVAARIAAEDDSKGRLPSGGVHSAGPVTDIDDAISIEFKEFLKLGAAMSSCSTDEKSTREIQIARSAGGNLIKNGVMDIFTCPEVDMKRYIQGGQYDLILQKQVYKLPYISWLGSNIVARIGYNYYAGFETDQWPEALPPEAVKWKSADKITDSGRCVLMTDRTRWVPNPSGFIPFKITEIAHTNRGFYVEHDTPNAGIDPREINGAGGNVGYLDGSVEFIKYSGGKAHPRQVTYTGTGSFEVEDYSFF